MMAGLLSLLRLDPMFCIYQKITSGAQKNGPGAAIRLIDRNRWFFDPQPLPTRPGAQNR